MLNPFDLTTLKHTSKLLFQHVARLSCKDLKNVLTKHGPTWNTELSKLSISVPGNQAILTIDCVQRQRQAIDNRLDKTFLCFRLRSSFFNFAGETYRLVTGCLVERADVRR